MTFKMAARPIVLQSGQRETQLLFLNSLDESWFFIKFFNFHQDVQALIKTYHIPSMNLGDRSVLKLRDLFFP